MRLIWNANELRRAFISGPALDQGLGYFTVIANDNDWVPAEENGVFAT